MAWHEVAPTKQSECRECREHCQYSLSFELSQHRVELKVVDYDSCHADVVGPPIGTACNEERQPTDESDDENNGRNPIRGGAPASGALHTVLGIALHAVLSRAAQEKSESRPRAGNHPYFHNSLTEQRFP